VAIKIAPSRVIARQACAVSAAAVPIVSPNESGASASAARRTCRQARQSFSPARLTAGAAADRS
jgi:hypothetical protein